MPRNYKNIKNKKSRSITNRFSGLLSFITGLTLGLFIAVIVYFHEHNATIENDNILLNKKIAEDNKKSVAQLPEPQFDFYKILPNKEVNISEWESVEKENTDEKLEEQPAIFVLQVGSFKEFETADKVKAKLALIGVKADIQRVVINGQDIRHRVRIGPYKDLKKLKETKDRLLANDTSFMLLKLKMEDIQL